MLKPLLNLFRKYVLLYFLREMAERRRSFWGWTTDEWIETIERRKKVEYQHVITSCRESRAIL